MGDKSEHILVVCAHSDDQIFGVGGALARFAKEGKQITTLIFSYGENSHPWLQRNVTVQMRVQESYEADKVIGGSGVRFLGIPEGKFLEERNADMAHTEIRTYLRRMRPSKIFTHSQDDPHPDHQAVSSILLRAFDSLSLPSHVYTFDVWSPVKVKDRHHPKYIVPISHTFKTKLRALRCFKSQWAAMFMLLWSVYVRAAKNGILHGTLFAERFYKVR